MKLPKLPAYASILLGAALAPGCGANPAPPANEPAKTPARAAESEADARALESAGAGAKPTVEDARAFFTQVDKDLRRLWVARDQASWVSMTYITDDTQALAAAGEMATAEYVAKVVKAARRFDSLSLPPDLERQLLLLRLAQTIPAPSDAAKRAELATIQTSMTGAYGKAKYCPPRLAGKCLTLDDLNRTLRTSRNEAELKETWTAWHELARPLREPYARYVELANQGAREIGFSDVGALWRSGYDMTPDAFEAEVARLWDQMKPLYEQLHCYVRARLRAKYGKDLVPEKGLIPIHLLGNMSGQDWTAAYGLAEPYAGFPSLDVTKKLVQTKVSPTAMVRLGEKFFTSLGFDALPKTFWERSLFTRPRDREVVCHASAWDVNWNGDLRIKMCIEPDEDDLITIHHELGHDYYFQQYHTLPMLFQGGANDGFHEGIGDTLALSVTPKYLKSLGLVDAVKDDPRAVVNEQLKLAMTKVAVLPFALLVDKWRWGVFSGKIPKEKYNEAFWAIRRELQGIAPPSPRGDDAFDPGAKFHVPASTPYTRYFLADVYQFQFHRALCKAAGHTGPLHTCSIYGNKAAGEKLKAMLALGASKPWPEALAVLSGEKSADATAMSDYFKPLSDFLAEKNKGQTCGW